MGRPSKAEERTEQILDAFERCIVRFGLAGSSLEQIAKEAGVKRSILRHYVGNRDALIDALLTRTASRYQENLEEVFSDLSGDTAEERLLALLFPEVAKSTMEAVVIIEAFIALAHENERCRDLMTAYIEAYVTKIAEELFQDFERAGWDACWEVAYGLLSLNFNHESLVTLKLPSKYLAAASSSARVLIDSLRAR